MTRTADLLSQKQRLTNFHFTPTLTYFYLFQTLLSASIVRSQDINGELIRGLPCVKRFNQLFCNHGGAEYPE